MLGKRFNPIRTVETVNIEELIPKNHFLRKIDRVLDLSFLDEFLTSKYSYGKGRPSIEPELYFRIVLLGTLVGIQSDRQLCENIRFNLAYRWFVRIALSEKVPDHSSLTRIRDRLGEEVFQQVFERILEQCRQAGLLNGKKLMMDSTMVESNASRASLKRIVPKKELSKNDDSVREKTVFKNSTHVSSTDPDAKMVNRAITLNNRLYYKVHYSADFDSRIITDCHVTSGNVPENTVLQERIKYQQVKYGFQLDEIIADRFYGTGDTYKFLLDEGIAHFIPLKRQKQGEGIYSVHGLKYNADEDYLVCPAGHKLFPYEKVVSGGSKYYRLLGGHCNNCPFRSTCISERATKKNKVCLRHPAHNEIEKVKERCQTGEFKQRLQERQWKLEGLFGEGKERHGLRRAKYRRKSKFQIQVYLIAIVQNIKRLMAFIVLFFSGKILFEKGFKTIHWSRLLIAS